MKVFVVNGQGQSGKDSFEKFISEIAWRMDKVRVVKTSMINGVKELAKVVGWDGKNKEMKDRRFLYELKQLCDGYNDYSYAWTYKDVMTFSNRDIDVVFVDAREKEDIERLKNDFAAETILIRRGKAKNYENAADDGVFTIEYDYIIENNGSLEDLKNEARIFYLQHILNS